MKNKKKLLMLCLTLAVVVCLGTTLAIFVHSQLSTPSLKIEKKNLSLTDPISINFAVSHNNVDNIRLLVWSAPQSEYTYENCERIIETAGNTTIEGKSCQVFKATGLAARQMTDVIYVRAYGVADEEPVYSDVMKYSVLDYAYEVAAKSTDEGLKKVMSTMLEYGAATQSFLGYKTDRLATADFRQMKILGGLLDDGTNIGLYLAGDKVTLSSKGLTAPTWTSSNTEAVTVSDGVLTLVDSGIATITATDGTNTIEYLVAFTESGKLAEGMVISKSELDIKIGEFDTLSAGVMTSEHADATLSWESSNPKVASVDSNGKISALSSGSTVITVTASTGESATCTVTSDWSRGTLDVKWNCGYVGSASNTQGFVNKINTAGGVYSYSDVVTIPKKGTIITFVDDNINQNNDTGYASAAAYVFSSWKLEDGEWVIDLSGANYDGSNTQIYTTDNGVRTYTYTTTKDNENLRFCYRSGQSTTFTPDHADINYLETNGRAYSVSLNKSSTTLALGANETLTASMLPSTATDTFTWTSSDSSIVSVNSNGKLTSVSAGTVTITVTSSSGMSATCKVTSGIKWNSGYVGSDANTQGYVNMIKPAGSGYAYTDIITVPKKGTKITFTDTESYASAAAYVISEWLDEDNINLDGANFAGTSTEIYTAVGSTRVYTYITYKDNEKIRLCFNCDSLSVSNQSAFPFVTFEYTGEKGTFEDMANLSSWISESKEKTNYTQLEGVTMNIIGDSYFAGNGLSPEYVWPALLAEKYNMTFNNQGKNGSTIGTYVTNKNPMVNRYTNMPDNDADIILVEGGKNDFNVHTPIGTNTSTDTSTFKGAINTMINAMQERYPNALIIFVTCWNVNQTNNLGLTVTNYAEAMIEVCEYRGVVCFNAADTEATGVNMNNATFRKNYCQTANDVSHLNIEGMKLVMPVFEKFIAEQYAAFLNSKNS